MHILHLWVRISQIRRVPDSDLGWEDMYHEGEGESWFDWVRPTTCSTSSILTTPPDRSGDRSGDFRVGL